MYKILKHIYLFIFSLLVMSACDDTALNDGIPQVIVNETINLNNYQYQALGIIGGYVYVNAGVRGIILYRSSASEYLAIEQNCTYQPMDPCANVRVDVSSLFLIDTCCHSTFDFNGFPTGGPASYPLRLYKTSVNQNFLTITNDF